MVVLKEMDNLSTKTSIGHYYYPYYYYKNKSKRISGLGSYDPKYYDEIITKLNLQARERHEHSKGQTASSRNKKKKKKRILLVDDEPDICMVYQMMLEDAGYECISYTDSLKALQEFKPCFYDLILLDIKMPVLNGFELAKKGRLIKQYISSL